MRTPPRSTLVRLCSLLVSTGLLIAACGGGGKGAPSGGGSSERTGGSTFKLGVEAPLTGPDAESGQEILNATKMAFAEIGNQIGGTRIELVSIDDKADPAAAVSAYTYAISKQGVQAIFGNWNTDVTLAVMPVSERYKIPHFFYGALGQAVDDKVKSSNPQYFFGKQYPPPGEQQIAYVDALEYALAHGLELPSGKTVALFGEDTAFGRGVVSTLSQLFRQHGWQVKGQEFFPIDATDHTAMLNTFMSQHVSVIAGTGTALQGMASLIKQARSLGFHGILICDGLSYTGDWYKATGSASDGVMDLNVLFATPAAKTFEQRYRQEYNTPPSPFAAGITYDYAKFLIEIMKRALQKYGKLTSETMTLIGRDELKTGKLSYNGIMMKRYVFTPQSWPVPVSGEDGYLAPVVQYWSGKPEIVYPPNLAQSPIRLQ
ncbi:MAG: ABC transporter substrate-binding protein [Acidothermus cellulolyticus]|nr:ABC transporter substrate-binding protein [Acidothermus cellulolyticus]